MTALQTARPRPRPRRGVGRAFAGVGVWLYAATLFVPIYYVFISSFKENNEMFSDPWVPTFSQGISHYVDVWNRLNVPQAVFNSLYITTAAILLTIVLAVPAAYALARSTGRLGRLVERVFALGFLIPGFAALVPTLLLAIALGMYHTREYMILYLPAAAQPLSVILLTQFMRTVPAELEESATIDGASRFQILMRVYLPLTAGGIATIAILNFIAFWNEYLFSLILVGTEEAKRTLQVAMPTLATNFSFVDNALVSAGTIVSIAPVFLVYAILNRRMENALVEGAVKG